MSSPGQRRALQMGAGAPLRAEVSWDNEELREGRP